MLSTSNSNHALLSRGQMVSSHHSLWHPYLVLHSIFLLGFPSGVFIITEYFNKSNFKLLH